MRLRFAFLLITWVTRGWGVGPFVESQKPPAQRAERRRLTSLLLDAARVTGEGSGVRGRAGGPRDNALSPQRLAPPSHRGQRGHGEILGQPGPVRGVSAVSVQKRRLPDNQVASRQGDLDDRMVADVGGTRDRTSLGPFVEEAPLVAVDGGDALEATHVGGRIL